MVQSWHKPPQPKYPDAKKFHCDYPSCDSHVYLTPREHDTGYPVYCIDHLQGMKGILKQRGLLNDTANT